jgi:hypothetical protein
MLHVTQNGVMEGGAMTMTANGQVIASLVAATLLLAGTGQATP